MIGTIHPIGKAVPLQEWRLGENLGKGFEEAIHPLLTAQLKPYFAKGVTLRSTSLFRDDGKDFIIESPIDLRNLFGCHFRRRGKQRIKIFIECKSSDHGRIRYGKIMENATRVKSAGIDYFVLITNTGIGPHTYYAVSNELSEQGITFILIDQYILAKSMREYGSQIGNGISLENMPDSQAEYQSFMDENDGKRVYSLFMVFRNYAATEKLITLRLLTDRNWQAGETELTFVVDPNGGCAKKIDIIRAFSDGIDDLLFSIRLGVAETQVLIRGDDFACTFEPPFVGENHTKCVFDFIEKIKTAKEFQLHYIWG
ncbi:MAG: hypothetical protein LBJ11_03825 [Oscillospiraceae bacterium]|jgi:hypothetical protein|nr:hypothetical protein [Oscillospiraceae bacterium]